MNQSPTNVDQNSLNIAQRGDSCSLEFSPASAPQQASREQEAFKNTLLETEYAALKILYDLDEKLECKRFSEILQKTCEQFFKTKNFTIQKLLYRTIFSGLSFLIQVEEKFTDVYKSSQDLFSAMKKVIQDQFGEDLASEHIEEVYLIRTRKFYKEGREISPNKN